MRRYKINPNVNVPPEDYTCPSGDGTVQHYKMKFDESDGHRYLIPDGKRNMYDEIQSYADSVDLNVIFTKFRNGDTSVLQKLDGLYGDFSTIPTSLVDLKNRVMDAENVFNQLPLDLREKFDFDASKFYSMFGSEEYNDIVKDFIPEPPKNEAVEAIKTLNKSIYDLHSTLGGVEIESQSEL